MTAHHLTRLVSLDVDGQLIDLDSEETLPLRLGGIRAGTVGELRIEYAVRVRVTPARYGRSWEDCTPEYRDVECSLESADVAWETGETERLNATDAGAVWGHFEGECCDE